MKELTTGANTVVEPSLVARVQWSPASIGGHEVDASAFLLTGDGRVRSDADFIFYNQPRSTGGEVEVTGDSGDQRFAIDLGRLPAEIQKVALAVTIHGAASFSDAQSMSLEIQGAARYAPPVGSMGESALILAELYRRNDQWKVRAVGQGFEGGLGPLARHFGVEVADDDPGEATPAAGASTASAPANTSGVRLEKKLVDLQKKAPELVDLVKKVQVTLEKKGVKRDRAKVALCLDISGSMSGLFRRGKIDTLVKRVMALGYRFDDDGEIDVFLFGAKAHEYGSVGAANYRTFVSSMLSEYDLEAGTYYGKAMGLVREFYAKDLQTKKIPVYVMFVTDGNTMDKERTEREVKESSHDPIFWQFMAIGKKPKKKGFFARLVGTGFEFLEKLDDMEGRAVDNADFFLLEDPAEPTDEEMFELLMNEYPGWLKAVVDKRILID